MNHRAKRSRTKVQSLGASITQRVESYRIPDLLETSRGCFAAVEEIGAIGVCRCIHRPAPTRLAEAASFCTVVCFQALRVALTRVAVSSVMRLRIGSCEIFSMIPMAEFRSSCSSSTAMAKLRNWLLKPVMHVTAWVAGYQAAQLLLIGTSSVDAHADICAWWLALYAGYVLSIGLEACVPLFFGYFIVSACSSWLGSEWFIAEPARELGWWLLIIACGQALVFASPVVLNWFVRKLVDRTRGGTIGSSSVQREPKSAV